MLKLVTTISYEINNIEYYTTVFIYSKDDKIIILFSCDGFSYPRDANVDFYICSSIKNLFLYNKFSIIDTSARNYNKTPFHRINEYTNGVVNTEFSYVEDIDSFIKELEK